MRIESFQSGRQDEFRVAQPKHLTANIPNGPTQITGQAPVAPEALDVVDVVDIETPATPDVPTGDGAADETEESVKDRGVLRLIAEGHFRGAAAARLRLNFFDQLNHASLPPLPEASGNGRGYAKFRAEYEARLAEANPEPPAVEPPPGDEAPPIDGIEPPPTEGVEPPPADGIADPPAPIGGATVAALSTQPMLSFGRLSILA